MLIGVHYSFLVMYIQLLWVCPLLSPERSSLIPNCSKLFSHTHTHEVFVMGIHFSKGNLRLNLRCSKTDEPGSWPESAN